MDNSLEQVERTAKQITELIEPLGDLEQHAALQMAETIRAYQQVSRTCRPHQGEALRPASDRGALSADQASA